MKIGAQLQAAIQNMDKQVEMAKRVASETQAAPTPGVEEANAVEEADGPLGHNVDEKA